MNIKESQEMIDLLRKKVANLESKLITQETSAKTLTELAVGFFQDKDGFFHKVVVKFNPETKASAVTEDEKISKHFAQSTLKVRDFLEMNIFLDTTRR